MFCWLSYFSLKTAKDRESKSSLSSSPGNFTWDGRFYFFLELTVFLPIADIQTYIHTSYFIDIDRFSFWNFFLIICLFNLVDLENLNIKKIIFYFFQWVMLFIYSLYFLLNNPASKTSSDQKWKDFHMTIFVMKYIFDRLTCSYTTFLARKMFYFYIKFMNSISHKCAIFRQSIKNMYKKVLQKADMNMLFHLVHFYV